VNLSKLDVRNLIKENTYSEVNVNIFNFWNSGLQGDLLEDPDMTRIIVYLTALTSSAEIPIAQQADQREQRI
jgi:hypothetical protein